MTVAGRNTRVVWQAQDVSNRKLPPNALKVFDTVWFRVRVRRKPTNVTMANRLDTFTKKQKKKQRFGLQLS